MSHGERSRTMCEPFQRTPSSDSYRTLLRMTLYWFLFLKKTFFEKILYSPLCASLCVSERG